MSDVTIKTAVQASALGDDQILTDAGFHWRERGGVRVLICGPLEQAGFSNGFSTRLGGVSPFPKNDLNLAGFDEDTAENIEENRRRFLAAFDRPYRLSTAWQVHGDDVRIVANDDDVGTSDAKFDALISDLPDVLVGVKTADCVPILIGDPETRAFAAVHAGWRGSSKSIVRKAVARLSEIYGAEPTNLICSIGPAATCERYEIGEDVIEAFRSNFSTSGKYLTPTREGHALIDLHLANKDQLIDAGVRPECVFTAPFCTMERTDLFFSYRVEKKMYGKTGRLLSVIGQR